MDCEAKQDSTGFWAIWILKASVMGAAQAIWGQSELQERAIPLGRTGSARVGARVGARPVEQ